MAVDYFHNDLPRGARGARGADVAFDTEAQVVIESDIFVATGGATNLTQTARFDNANNFFGHAIAPGAIALTATRFDNSNTFNAVTLTKGAVSLSASRFDNANQFFTHEIVSSGLSAQRFDNANSFFAHSIALGAVSIQAGRFDNANTFFGHNVSAGQIQLSAGLFQNTNQFFAPSVEHIYTLVLTETQARRLEAVARLHGLIDPLVVNPTSRGDGTVMQTFTGSTNITVSTTLMPATPSVSAQLIDDLARWYGLVDPMIEQAASRSDGVLTQSVVTVGDETTVTRL